MAECLDCIWKSTAGGCFTAQSHTETVHGKVKEYESEFLMELNNWGVCDRCFSCRSERHLHVRVCATQRDTQAY